MQQRFPNRQSVSVRIGCNTLYPDGRLEREEQFSLAAQCRALETIAEAGFSAVEFSHIGHLRDEELETLAARAAELGLLAWSVHSWTTIPATRSAVEKAVEQLTRCVHQCSILGARVLVVHCQVDQKTSEEGLRETHLATLLPACSAAEAVGCKVAIENCDRWEEWEYIIRLVDASGATNLGVNVDTGHANLHNVGVRRFIEAAGQRIMTTHLQDNFGHLDEHLPPGEGTIDWKETIEAFLAVGYGGVFMVEISDCPVNREPDAIADTQTAARNLRRFLQAAGATVQASPE